MNTEQHNFDAKQKRSAYLWSFYQSGGKENGKPDKMKPSIDWRETFAQWGYVPCVD